MSEASLENSDQNPPRLTFRHGISTRLWHWINAAVFLVMLMSGLTIFNAHPRLYWGQAGARYDRAWLQVGSADDHGFVQIGSKKIDTTGVLGIWETRRGELSRRAFPSWATLPGYYDLAVGRLWHLTFVWPFAVGLVLYALWSLVNGHLRRDLLPGWRECDPRSLSRCVGAHVHLQFAPEQPGTIYNSLQKISYFVVLMVLLPGMILSGLTMSPAMNAALPWLLDLFGGRQSARSIHFIFATLLVLFVVVHLALVLLAGPFNQLRGMITGWFREPVRKDKI